MQDIPKSAGEIHHCPGPAMAGGILATGGSKRCITVSTLAEAEFYATEGFEVLKGYGSTGEDEWESTGVGKGVGKCPTLGILNITFKYVLEIISPVGFNWDMYQHLFNVNQWDF